MHHSASSSTWFEIDSSEADLDIEAQRTTNVSHGQQNGTYSSHGAPLLATNIPRSHDSFQNRGNGATPPTEDTESVPEYLTNLILSDFYAPPGVDVQMSPEIFSEMSDGDIASLVQYLGTSMGTSMACLKSNTGDSILHLAATWGHLELVKKIIPKYPHLISEQNSSGHTPLHLAAHGGHTLVVKVFVETVTFASTRLCTEETLTALEESQRLRLRLRLNPYVLKDKDGNTAVYYAIEGRHKEMATCLVNANQDAPFLGNNEGISSLYEAVAAGSEYKSLVEEILKTIGNEDLDSKLQGNKYLAHVALHAKSIDVLDVILKKYPNLVNERDKDGRTCLSLGAYIGYYEGVCNLLARSKKSVFVCDEDGSFPIHTAAEKGHEKIVKKFIKDCKNSKYLLNKLGQNVLHVAAKNGESSITNLLMSEKDTKHLGVGQDVDGNTPLHLAVMNWHYKSITCLASSSDILKLRNKSGLRARDIIESNVKPNYIFHERWTLALLLYAIHKTDFEPVKSLTRPAVPRDPKNNRDYVNTLLLVATLVATVTFAAGFTVPGGFNSDADKPNLGRATLASNPTLFIFLLLDILAMQCSVATIVMQRISKTNNTFVTFELSLLFGFLFLMGHMFVGLKTSILF